eukprot:2964391-Amphidinium_carterae.1
MPWDRVTINSRPPAFVTTSVARLLHARDAGLVPFIALCIATHIPVCIDPWVVVHRSAQVIATKLTTILGILMLGVA